MNLRPALAVSESELVSLDIARIQGAFVLHELDSRAASVRLLLDSVWSALRLFRSQDVLELTETLETLLRRGELAMYSELADEAQCLVSIGYIWRDNVGEALRLAQGLLQRAPAWRFRSVIAAVLRLCYWRSRDFQAFYALQRPRLQQGSKVSALVQVVSLSTEAAAEAEQLRFKLAERLARDAIELSGRSMGGDANAALLSTCVLANIAYEIGAIDDADLLIRGRVPSIEQHGSVESALWGFIVSARIARARGNIDLALLTLRKGADIGMVRRWPRLVTRCMAEEVAMLIADKRVDQAVRVLASAHDRLANMLPSAPFRAEDAWPLEMARHRMSLAAGEAASAAGGLRRLRDAALNINHPALLVRLTSLLAGALHAAGETEQARGELLGALQLGVGAGAFRTFIDEMPAIECCLRGVRFTEGTRLGYLRPYILSLLTAVPSSMERKRPCSPHGSLELLSHKEATILRLISMGLSNKSVARELRIAPETVKSHAKRIFIKLSTRTRAEAVARAAELGLL